MTFANLIKKLTNPLGDINDKNLNGNCVAKDFGRVVKRERARADRGGLRFSIINFNIGKSKPNDASAESLLKLLSKSVRITDEFGWIKKHHIGALLFNAGTDDARRFAGKIRDELSQTAVPLDYSVCTYPHNLLDFDEGGGNSDSGPKCDDSADEHIIEYEFSSFSQNTENTTSDTGMNFVRKIPIWKRCTDIIGAFFALVIFFPLLLLIGLLIKVVSPGPVFFKQERIGYGGKKFVFFKFRTMKVNADTCTHQNYLSDLINGCRDLEKSGKPMAKLDPNDSQIIPFGKFLRNTCLDELPQLINVLRGEMSLVGPRPPIPYEVKEYLRWHNGRFDILPGMTGLWQVSGKNRLTFKEMIRLDIRYTRNISFWSDVKILCKTPGAIINEFKFYRDQVGSVKKGVEQNV